MSNWKLLEKWFSSSERELYEMLLEIRKKCLSERKFFQTADNRLIRFEKDWGMVFVITENGRVFEERVPSSAYGESYYKFYRSEDDEPERISFFLSVRLGPENSDWLKYEAKFCESKSGKPSFRFSKISEVSAERSGSADHSRNSGGRYEWNEHDDESVMEALEQILRRVRRNDPGIDGESARSIAGKRLYAAFSRLFGNQRETAGNSRKSSSDYSRDSLI